MFGVWDIRIQTRPTTAAFGSSSRTNSTRFGPNSPADIPARSVQASDKTHGDRVTRGDEYDGDRRGRAFGYQDRNVTTPCKKHINPTPNQIERKRRNSLEM
jgi:hypothetical protein